MPQKKQSNARIFMASPHRMLFFGGVVAINLAMLWWFFVLSAWAFGLALPLPALPPMFLHGWLLIYGTFPYFVLGFLMTAMPSWVNAPPVRPNHYQPVALSLYLGFAFAFAGAMFGPKIAAIGMVLTTFGIIGGILVLCLTFYQGKKKITTPHPILALGLLTGGIIGAILATIGMTIQNWLLLKAGLYLGAWGFLIPMVFMVAHRMLPFFTANLFRDYQVWRPSYSPFVFFTLTFAQALLCMTANNAYFLLTAPLLGLFVLWHLLRWRFWIARQHSLLWVAYLSLWWMPIAACLYTLSGLSQVCSWQWHFENAAFHASIALLASMVLAFVTRVSCGHSGRSLILNRLDGLAFVLLQTAMLTRVAAALPMLANKAVYLYSLAALLWIFAFLPWGIRYGLIYWLPRIDGKPG